MELKIEPVLERIDVVVFRGDVKIVVRDVLAYSYGDGDIEILDYEKERIRKEVLKYSEVV